MADKGFTVSKEIADLGVVLIIPNFKGHDHSQMTKEETEGSASIAELRMLRELYKGFAHPTFGMLLRNSCRRTS